MYFGKIKDSEDGWIFSDNEKIFESYIEISEKEQMLLIKQSNEEHKMIKGDEDGNPILVDRPKPTRKEQNQNRINELEIYLKETDWYAIRYADTGEVIPEDIRQKRQSARDEISRLREETDDSISNSSDD